LDEAAGREPGTQGLKLLSARPVSALERKQKTPAVPARRPACERTPSATEGSQRPRPQPLIFVEALADEPHEEPDDPPVELVKMHEVLARIRALP
jgi:hypothetical protein